MKYCHHCVIPDTRPNIEIGDDGVCNACTAHASRATIDWVEREERFRAVVEHAKSRSNGYDCLIPVSGGKDSTWQVIKCLDYGLNPLAVTWKPPSRTNVGRHNLESLVRLGVDHIDYQISPPVERKFVYLSLVNYGTTAIPMHMALFNIPLTVAVRFKIPLAVWGENSAFEYGGKEEERTGFRLNERWLKKYGVTHGTTAADWVSEELSEAELTAYFGPSDADLEQAGVLAAFLGYYFPWDPETSLKAAIASGFQARDEGPKTGFYDYADIDDDFISIHHYLKWYKFGFTRLFDNLSLEIRNGRMSREKAISLIREFGPQTPREDIDKLCEFLHITVSHFYEIAETIRNPEVWTRRGNQWVIKDFLVPDWDWSRQ